MKTSELRQKYLQFFESKGHQIVRSSSLVPHNDPTLLFTNAGMNQFKDVFLGFDKRSYTRATTAQKCVRAGGKHNDLENVGYTARHHTFFEMLGNFSFGDYFKQQAIHYAWEFLTSPEWLNLPKEKLLVTVYAEDDEAYNIWHKEIGLPENKIVRIGDNKGAKYASDNFWQMGDTGPCGPCTEIFYDHGEHIWGGIPGSPEEDGDRWIEIWNNVFMQFNRDEQGNMNPLPKPSVDTGMGLERMAAVMQGVHSNYEIDLFQNLLKAVARETGVEFSMDVPSLKVIADHIRSCSFLIADGVLPSNEGRGYVLRRIIRRAVRHGYKLGQKQAFFYKLVPDLVKEMGDAYPELREKQTQIEEALKAEETRFAQTLETGMVLLENALSGSLKRLNGEIIFKLYDTYGFPYDLTADICREREVEMDEDGFNKAMDEQRARARAAQNFKANTQLDYNGQDTQFKGYSERKVNATVIALYKDSEAVTELHEGETGAIVLDQTPFYAESGGQVGDVGYILAGENRFEVRDTQKIKAAVFGQFGVQVSGSLKVGDSVLAEIDNDIRDANMRNHSATHLMHKALREVLGNHVEQKGSLVTAESTRFDISHNQAITPEEIAEVERRVNTAILANVAVDANIMSMEDAQKTGAMMLFGEKYGDEVRVLQMGEFSTELCGGTHVARTGDIGLFKIISESGIAAGVRRLEVITGLNALRWAQNQETLLKNIISEVKAQTEKDVLSKIQANANQTKALEKELAKAKAELAVHAGAKLLDNAKDLGTVSLVVAQIDAEASALRDIVTDLTGKSDKAVVLLAAVNDGKVSLCAGVSKPLTAKVKAGDLVKFAAEQVGGKGGGRPDLAQAGGTDAAKLPETLASVENWVNNLPEKYRSLFIKNKDLTMSKYSVQQQPIETLLSWIKSGEIAIPEIQRPFVWNASKVRDLLDSLHKGYPVGYIITWRNPDIRLKDGTLSAGKRVLIDGQQRITALTAAVVGQAVLNKEYKQNKIKIAYNPQVKDHESAFEVCNNAIERNPIWIDDIAPILNGDTPISKIRRQYLEKNPTVDEDKIEEKINELQAIKNRQIGIIELNPDLEIDTVTEIFIRINQKGVVLSNADFVMSKIAADQQFGGNTLRKMIDYFCHLLNDSSFAKHIESNDTQFFQSPDFVKIKWIAQYTDNLYHPNYIDVLRVAYTYAFQRGRFSDLVALLSGRDFEKRSNTEEIAQQSYEKLRTGLMAFFNETHYKRFLLLIRSAGFIHANLLNSQNSLNIAYAIYLHLCDLKMSEHEIQHWVKKWFVMSLLTGRYSGSSESVIERDIKQIQEKGIQEYFQLIELAELNSGFWEHTLVRDLDSSSNVNAAYLCYLAAQCQNQEKAFLSGSVKVSDLFETRGDEHHFFPKAYLEKHGYKKSEYNQIANFVYTEQQINIRLQDKPPFEYLQQIQQDIEQGKQQYTSIPSLVEWRENLAVHCIPENWQAFRQENYADFLQERRKLMAKKIQQFYDKF